MALTQDQLNAIQAKLAEKGVSSCPSCRRTSTWSIVPDLATVRLQPPESIADFMVGGQVLPCVVIVCHNCGNTELHNVFALGLSDILDVKPKMAEVKNG
jgi:predicted nucleic-acid-binding Zn-ribbon protein